MQTYKFISVFKRKAKEGVEVNPAAPGYDITVSNKNPDGSYGKSINVGALWLKDGQAGKYYSGNFSNTNGEYTGYVLVREDELTKVLKLAEAMEQKLRSPLGDGYPTEVEKGVPVVSNIELNPEDIPF